MTDARFSLMRPGFRLLPLLGLVLGALSSLFPVSRALDYPLSLVLSPSLALLFLGWGAFAPQALDAQQRLRPWLLLAATWGLALVGPAVGSAMGSICEPLYGLGFLFLGPLASGACGLVAGMALQKIIRRRGLRILAILGLIVGELALVAAEFWFTPCVRFYGWLFGMYHGAIYDEAVRITTPYLWLRFKDLLWVGALYVWVFPVRIARFTPWVAAAGAGMVLLFSPWLRFTASYIPLETALGATHQSAHFVLHASPGGKAIPLLPRLAEDLEFRLWQQSELFALNPLEAPVDIYVYESPLQKEALMGAGRTTISKPWRREIHLHTVKPGETLIAHELAHVLLSQFSDSPLAVPSHWGLIPKPGILEGAATAVERGGSRLTQHGWARAMRDIGKRPNMEAILSGLSFWGHSGALAYTACGSFVRYLLESYGPAPFASLYAGSDFQQAYGKPLAHLLQGWDQFLDSVSVSEGDLLLAEFLFTQQSVFQKTCAHAGARCLQDVGAAVRQQRTEEAAGLARRALILTEGDPRVGKEVGSLLLALSATAQARDVLGENPGIDTEKAGKSLQISLQVWDLDARWLLGQGRAAHEGYRQLASDLSIRTLLGPELSWRLLLSGKATSLALRRLLVAPILDKELETLVGETLATAAELPRLDQALLGRFLLTRPKWEAQAIDLLRPLVAPGMPTWLAKQTTGKDPELSSSQACTLYVDLSLKLAAALTFRGDLDGAEALLRSVSQTSPTGLHGTQLDADCVPPGTEEATSDLQRRILWKRQYLEENQERTRQEEEPTSSP